MPGRCRSRAPPRSRASPRCAPISTLGLAQGIFLPHPRPNHAWLAELGTTIDAGRAGAGRERDVGVGDVGGQRRDRLAGARHRRPPLPPDRRQPPHHAAPQPRMAGDAGAAANRVRGCRAVRRPPAGAAGVRRRRRGQPHAPRSGLRRTGRRDLRLWRVGRRLPRAPARRGVEGDRPAATGSIPARTLFAEQSEEAIAAGAFHNDVVAVANGPLLFAHEKAFAERDSLIADCERLVPGFELVEVPASRGSARRRGLFLSVQCPAGEPGQWRDDADRPRRSAGNPVGLELAAAPPRRQWPDPPGRGGRRAPVDGQRRRPRLPPAARGRRSGDHRSALPGRCMPGSM